MAEIGVLIFNVHERIRGDYSFEIRDRDGVVVPGSALTSARMSLYLNYDTPVSGRFVNGRELQNVLQMNDVTISEVGKVVWDIQSADMAIVNETFNFEQRVAVFELVWSRGLILHEVAFNVRNVLHI